MNPLKCLKLDECYKVKMILDKDLLDFQYGQSSIKAHLFMITSAIRQVCATCKEGEELSKTIKVTNGVSSHEDKMTIENAIKNIQKELDEHPYHKSTPFYRSCKLVIETLKAGALVQFHEHPLGETKE